MFFHYGRTDIRPDMRRSCLPRERIVFSILIYVAICVDHPSHAKTLVSRFSFEGPYKLKCGGLGAGPYINFSAALTRLRDATEPSQNFRTI